MSYFSLKLLVVQNNVIGALLARIGGTSLDVLDGGRGPEKRYHQKAKCILQIWTYAKSSGGKEAPSRK